MAEVRSIRPEAIVKVGGSLFGDPARLRSVLGMLSQAGVPLVIVPGGGPFADAVRAAQAALRFSEPCAHDLAMLAMRQTAGVFAGLENRLIVADALGEASDILAEGLVPVLVPRLELNEDTSFPKTWEATSDAIACWTGVRLRAGRIVFVKSRSAPAGSVPEELARAGVIDQVSPGILASAGIETLVVGPGEDDGLARFVGCARASGRGSG